MRWIRYDRRFGSWLALAALALQLAVSFGHVHLDDLRGIHPSGASARSTTQAVHPLPNEQPGDDDDGYCAICASIYLASTTFLPQAPQLPVPTVSRSVEHFNGAAVAFIVPPRAPFQSRAPPLA